MGGCRLRTDRPNPGLQPCRSDRSTQLVNAMKNAHAIQTFLLGTLLFAHPFSSLAQKTPTGTETTNRTTTRELVQKIGNTDIYHLKESKGVYFFETTMQINADGAPTAYHKNLDLGLDYLANAGSKGNWWGLVTDTGDSHGKPITQDAGDPAPGFYVSGTTLQDSTKEHGDQNRYVDSETIPFYVLPKKINIPMQIGDFGFVINRKNNTSSGCIFADVGPEDSIGEGSIALAHAIGTQSDPREEGSEDKFIYVIFANSAMGWPLTVDFINEHAKQLFEAWGGHRRLQEALPSRSPNPQNAATANASQ
ncbi:glycoside hydrolase family 75 protein [Desulfovibrio sp. DV]|uniref:glycoside hydrolase family 75 protein n=1 Tax=Desulfovibrio sp. DV TaxID=1844708 RepID=UPI0009F9AA25|nr:glycoside hydrolase family 75 protein [Desulfovibrio sp. DV]